MGQLCSSEQIQHENRNSQRKKGERPSRQNDYYAQGSINVPPVPESNQGNNYSKPLFCPENDTTNYNSLYRPYRENNEHQQQHGVQLDSSYQQRNNDTETTTQEDNQEQETSRIQKNIVLFVLNHLNC